jgi:uncharacterized membrane protein
LLQIFTNRLLALLQAQNIAHSMKKILIALVALLCWAGCEYDTITPKVVTLPDEAVSYASQIQTVFDAKCIACHSAQSPILVSSSSYTNLKTGNLVNTTTPASSKIYTQAKSGHPGGANAMSVTELAYLLKWITEGAANN